MHRIVTLSTPARLLVAYVYTRIVKSPYYIHFATYPMILRTEQFEQFRLCLSVDTAWPVTPGSFQPDKGFLKRTV